MTLSEVLRVTACPIIKFPRYGYGKTSIFIQVLPKDLWKTSLSSMLTPDILAEVVWSITASNYTVLIELENYLSETEEDYLYRHLRKYFVPDPDAG